MDILWPILNAGVPMEAHSARWPHVVTQIYWTIFRRYRKPRLVMACTPVYSPRQCFSYVVTDTFWLAESHLCSHMDHFPIAPATSGLYRKTPANLDNFCGIFVVYRKTHANSIILWNFFLLPWVDPGVYIETRGSGNFHIRPYYPDSTVSRPICEVKQGQVRLVLAWGTSWEVRMLYIFFLHVR
jgi:hypothetical protein